MAQNLVGELMQHLASRHLHPTPQWLQSFTAGVRPTTPLPALKSTALFRLLATDITTTLSQPTASNFPADINKGVIQSRPLIGPILVQVLDIEDIGHSRWSQVQAIEAKERGETTKGREIIRVTDEDTPAEPISKGPHKLLLQDAKGTKAYAFELAGSEGLNTGMSMGTKLLLRNCHVRRGVIILEPGGVQILGGKIDALDKAWRDGLKDRLMAAARIQT